MLKHKTTLPRVQMKNGQRLHRQKMSGTKSLVVQAEEPKTAAMQIGNKTQWLGVGDPKNKIPILWRG